MKKRSLLLLFLLFIPIVSADIQLFESSRDVYNLNDEYELDTSISGNIEGFLKSTLYCNDYTLDYFIIPIDISNKETINVPDLKFNYLMLGECYVRISLFDTSWGLIEKKDSNNFEVSDNLIINVNLNNNNFLSGEKVRVYGDVKDMIGEDVDGFYFKIFLDDVEIESLESSDESFEYKFNLEDDIKTGEHSIKVEINDDYGNKGESELSFNIIAVATELKNWLNKIDFLPGEKVEIKALLYDQAGDLMDGDAEIKVFKDNDEILYKNVKIDEIVELVLEDKAKPGEWRIETKSEDFNIISYFNVLEVRDVNVYLENGKLFIKNLGNIIFEDNVVVYLDDFSFTKYVKLNIDDISNIELAGEVEEGDYYLKAYANDKEFDLGEITVEDDRNIIKKVGDMLTGSVVTDTKDIFSDRTTYLIIGIIIMIICALFVYLNRKKSGSVEKKREKDIIEGHLKLKRIKNEREEIRNKPKKRLFYSAKPVSKEEAEDFKEQMLKDHK